MAIEPRSKVAGDPPFGPNELVNLLELFDRKSCDEEHMEWDEVEFLLSECHRTLASMRHLTHEEEN